MPDFTEPKQKHRATWASGDYARSPKASRRSPTMSCGAGDPRRRAGARPRLRDRKHGADGAGAGAVVTGLDLTPELLAVARQRAAEEGYGDITWEVGTRKPSRSRTAASMSSYPRAA